MTGLADDLMDAFMGASPAGGDRTSYGASTVRRSRRTSAELEVIDQAIITAVEEDSPVTLRGVFYRAESAGAVEKTEAGYRLVGRELLKLRRARRVSYADITDGTRWITKPDTWTGLDQMLNDATASYRRALWHDQDTEVQVFTEKDAISGVILPVTEQWDVPLGVLRGYASESFSWSVADSIRAAGRRGKTVWLYQLGDHDPSGLDAWRSFRERVCGFLGPHTAEIEDADTLAPGLLYYPFPVGADDSDPVAYVWFDRLAVTEEQIEEWGLPTRPTKQSDPRSTGFGGGSTEVDAIRAPILRQLVEDAITQHIDPEALAVVRVAEQSERELLTRMHSDYQGEIDEIGGES